MMAMTCEQLGGPLRDDLSGMTTTTKVAIARDQPLEDAVEAGYEDHRPALEEMQGRWKQPL